MDGIDMRLLDDAERASCRAILQHDLPLRAFIRLFIALALWACACVVTLLLLTTVEAMGLAPVILLGLLVLVVPFVIVSKVGAQDVRCARQRLVNAYLADIRYGMRIYRDDVTYRGGKAIRSIQTSAGGSFTYRDRRGRVKSDYAEPEFEQVEVTYDAVPPAGEEWPDDSAKHRHRWGSYG